MEENIVRFVKFRDDGIFPVECADDIMTAVALFHLTVDTAQIFLLRFEIFLRNTDDQPHENSGDRNDEYGDQRHERTDRQHDDDDSDNRCHGGDQLSDTLAQTLSQSIDIVRDTGKNFSHRFRFKIFHRHAVDLFRDLAAHAITDFLRHTAHQPALNEGKQRADYVQPQHGEENISYSGEIDSAGSADFRHQAGENLRGGLTEYLRPENTEYRASYGEQDDRDESCAVRGDISQKLYKSPPEVFCFFARHAAPHVTAHAADGSFCR